MLINIKSKLITKTTIGLLSMQISKKTVSFLSLWSNGTTSSNNSIPSFMFDGGLTLNGKAQINCEKHSLLQTSTIMNEHKNLLSLVREISSYLKKQYNKQQITLPSGNSGGDKHPYSQYFIHHSNEFSKIEKQLQSGEILAVISDLELLLNQQFFQSILADDAKDGIKTTHLVNGTKYAQQLESIKKSLIAVTHSQELKSLPDEIFYGWDFFNKQLQLLVVTAATYDQLKQTILNIKKESERIEQMDKFLKPSDVQINSKMDTTKGIVRQITQRHPGLLKDVNIQSPVKRRLQFESNQLSKPNPWKYLIYLALIATTSVVAYILYDRFARSLPISEDFNEVISGLTDTCQKNLIELKKSDLELENKIIGYVNAPSIIKFVKKTLSKGGEKVSYNLIDQGTRI